MSVCIDDEGTVVDLIDNEQPEWPDWYELKALLERAAKWMIDDDEFGMLDLEFSHFGAQHALWKVGQRG